MTSELAVMCILGKMKRHMQKKVIHDKNKILRVSLKTEQLLQISPGYIFQAICTFFGTNKELHHMTRFTIGYVSIQYGLTAVKMYLDLHY